MESVKNKLKHFRESNNLHKEITTKAVTEDSIDTSLDTGTKSLPILSLLDTDFLDIKPFRWWRGCYKEWPLLTLTSTIFVYIMGQILFIWLEFGAVFFIMSLMNLIWLSLRKKDPKEISAYSVFNPNCERLLGQMTAEHFERDIKLRMTLQRKFYPDFEKEVFTAFRKLGADWGGISYENHICKFLITMMNETTVREIENSCNGWGRDARGKRKGVPFLKHTKQWLTKMDFGIKLYRRSFSAPPRNAIFYKDNYLQRHRTNSNTSDKDDPKDIHFVSYKECETSAELWNEFFQEEKKVIESRERNKRLW